MAENTTYAFSQADFRFRDPNNTPANNFMAVVIDSLPSVGSFMLNGNAVTVGQVLGVADIPNLTYTAPTDQFGDGLAYFMFRVQDDGGTANGGIDIDPISRIMKIHVT